MMCLKHCLLYLGIEDAEESDYDADGEKNEAPHSTPLVSSFLILFIVTDYMKYLSIVAPHIVKFVICHLHVHRCMHAFSDFIKSILYIVKICLTEQSNAYSYSL